MRNKKFFLLAGGLLAGLTTAAHAAVIDTSTNTNSGNTTLTTLDPGAPTVADGTGTSSTDPGTVTLPPVHHHHHSFRMMMEQMLQSEQSNPGSQSTDLLTSADLDFINSMPGMSGLAHLVHALESYSQSGGTLGGSLGNGGFFVFYFPGSYTPTPTPPPVIDPGNGGSVPEPTTAALMGGAGLAMVTGRRRKKA